MLQEYDYEIDHKPGKAHANAGALSRADIVDTNDMVGDINMLTTYAPTIDDCRLRDEQLRDVALGRLIERLVTDPELAHMYQVNSQGTLCWASGECAGGQQRFANERIVVPKIMVMEVLKVHRVAPYLGTTGEGKQDIIFKESTTGLA